MSSAENSNITVLVTGASGYLAAHVVHQLLQEGYQVRGTVRSLTNPLKVAPLQKLGDGAGGRLELVEADLTNEECWKDAVSGCEYVIHTASPFPFANPSDENEVIRPAVDGTLNVLKACPGQVKRVVLTSSTVAVGEAAIGPDILLSESDWTDENKPGLPAYNKSKKLAEKAAWDYVDGLADGQKFELAVINPSFILGPPLTEQGGSSIDFVSRVLTGKDFGLPKVWMSCTDVRDVARAHVIAMTNPGASGNRHIICNGALWLRDIGIVLKEEFGSQGYKPTSRNVPNFLIIIGSWFNAEMKTMRAFLGQVYNYDTSRMKDVLKIEPRPLKDTINDMGYALIESGKVEKTKEYKGR